MVDEPRQGGNSAAVVTSITDSVPVPSPIGENRNRIPRSTKGGLSFVALADLLNEPEEAVQYVVQDLLPAAGTSLLAGKPKAGKSTLARCLALSVARGDNWLGRECRQGTVLYLGLEEKRSEVRRHFAGLGAEDEPIYSFIERAPVQDATKMLAAAFDRYKPTLAIVDPLARFARVRDGSDYSEVTRSLEPLGALARESGVHIALVHHARKNTEGGPGDDALGSVAYMGGVDCGIILRRANGGQRTIHSVNRYGTDLEESIVALNEETGWVTVAGTKAASDASVVKDEVLTFIQNHDDGGEDVPVPLHAIRKGVKHHNQKVGQALGALVRDELIRREGKGTKGDPHVYLRL